MHAGEFWKFWHTADLSFLIHATLWSNQYTASIVGGFEYSLGTSCHVTRYLLFCLNMSEKDLTH